MEDSSKFQNVAGTADEGGNAATDERTIGKPIPVKQKELQREDNAEYVKEKNSYDSDSSDFDLEFTCETCSKAFSGLKPLKQHEKSLKHRKEIQKRKTKEKLRLQLEDDKNEDIEDDLLTSPFAFCEFCKKEFSGPESYQQHLKSKAHHKKKAKTRLMEKVSKDGVIDIEQLKIYGNKQHSQKAAATGAGACGSSPTFEDETTSSEDSDENPENAKQQFECTECGKVFSGVESYYQHMVSKTHRKILKQKKMAKELTENQVSNDSEVVTNDPEGTACQQSETKNSIQLVDDVLSCRLCHMSFSGPESASAHLKSRGHFKKLEHLKWKRLNFPFKSSSDSKEKRVTDVKENTTSNGKENLTAVEKLEPEVKTTNDNSGTPTLSKVTGSSQNVAGDTTREGLDVTGLRMPNATPSLKRSEDTTTDEEVKNTLLAYKTYKEYKKIMNDIQSEDA